MALGPVELLVIKFPGNQFRGEVVAALRDLVESGAVRIIDLLFVKKDAHGVVTSIELDDSEPDVHALYDPLVDEVDGLLTEGDAQRFAAGLEPDASIGLLLFENSWATRFQEAVVRARGELVLNERIPRAVVQELVEAHAALVAGS